MKSILILSTVFFGLSSFASGTIPKSFDCTGTKTTAHLQGISFRGNFSLNAASFTQNQEQVTMDSQNVKGEIPFLKVNFAHEVLTFNFGGLDDFRNYEVTTAAGDVIDTGACVFVN